MNGRATFVTGVLAALNLISSLLVGCGGVPRCEVKAEQASSSAPSASDILTPGAAASLATASLLGSGLLCRHMVVHSTRTNGEYVVAFYDADRYDENSSGSQVAIPYARVHIKDYPVLVERVAPPPRNGLDVCNVAEERIIVFATAWAANREGPYNRYELNVVKPQKKGRVALAFEFISGTNKHREVCMFVALDNVIAVALDE